MDANNNSSARNVYFTPTDAAASRTNVASTTHYRPILSARVGAPTSSKGTDVRNTDLALGPMNRSSVNSSLPTESELVLSANVRATNSYNCVNTQSIDLKLANIITPHAEIPNGSSFQLKLPTNVTTTKSSASTDDDLNKGNVNHNGVTMTNPADTSHRMPVDVEAERALLWCLLFNTYGKILTIDQRVHDFNLLWWFRWDHPRYILYNGSRAEGNCWEARIIIPGTFEVFPADNAPPIMPTPASIKRQKDQEAEILRLELDMIESQRAEQAAAEEMQDIPASYLSAWRIKQGEKQGDDIFLTDSMKRTEQDDKNVQELFGNERLQEIPLSHFNIWNINQSEEQHSDALVSDSGWEDNRQLREVSASFLDDEISPQSQAIHEPNISDQTNQRPYRKAPKATAPYAQQLHKKLSNYATAPTSSEALSPATPSTPELKLEALARTHRMGNALQHIRAHFSNPAAAEQVISSLDGLQDEIEWLVDNLI